MGRLLLGFAALAVYGFAAEAERVKDRLDAVVPAQMRQARTPGVSVAVIRGGKRLGAWAWGVRETGGTDAVTPRTLFQAASISKPVAALAALHMVDHGNFTLDEDVNGKLKSWKVPDNEFTDREKVTLRRLLSHSAGLTVHGFPGYEAGTPLPSVPDILDGKRPANTGPVRAERQPGSEWRYSGGGYTVMQLLLTDRLGWRFPEIPGRMVLERIGMTESTFEQPLPEEWRARAASGHRDDGSVVPGKWHTYPEMAAAGLWTTPSDLAKFLIEVWNAAAGRSNRVVERGLAREMLTRQKGDYGLGFGIEGEGAAEHFGHGGANAGFRCRMLMFRRSGDGVVVMTNGDGGAPVAALAIRTVAGALEWPSEREKPGKR